MSKIRVATLSLVAAVVLVWAVPAFAGPSKATGTVTVTAGKPSELKFTVSAKTVAKGATTFKVKNSGMLPHDFKINKKKTAMLAAGKSATLTVTFAKAGKYEYICSVPGHAAGGMKGTITVK